MRIPSRSDRPHASVRGICSRYSAHELAGSYHNTPLGAQVGRGWRPWSKWSGRAREAHAATSTSSSGMWVPLSSAAAYHHLPANTHATPATWAALAPEHAPAAPLPLTLTLNPQPSTLTLTLTLAIPPLLKIMGSNAELLQLAARHLAEKGAPRVDLNCGCPSNIVTGHGAGSRWGGARPDERNVAQQHHTVPPRSNRLLIKYIDRRSEKYINSKRPRRTHKRQKACCTGLEPTTSLLLEQFALLKCEL